MSRMETASAYTTSNDSAVDSNTNFLSLSKLSGAVRFEGSAARQNNFCILIPLKT